MGIARSANFKYGRFSGPLQAARIGEVLSMAPDSVQSQAAPEVVTRPLRVLHIYRRFHPDYTGDGIYYTRLLPLVAREGIEGEFLAFETDPPPAGLDVQRGIQVHYLKAAGLPPTTWGLLRWLARNGRRFDILHLHSHVDRPFLSCLLARAMGRPVLFSCTLDDSPTQILSHYRPSFRGLSRLLMRSISIFVVISPQLLRLSLQTVRPERLRFIPQGTALETPMPDLKGKAGARWTLGLAEEDFLLLNVGSVSRRKNLIFLVEMLGCLPDPAVKLMLVGPELEADYAAEIQERVAALGLAGRVLLPGFQDNAEPFYEAADAFVFASTAEGFPNVFLEAMAKGLPIISRFLPGLTDYVIEHGRSGFIADDEDAFAAAVEALRHDPAMRQAMGRASRHFADRNLALPAIAQCYAALYREQAMRGPAMGPPEATSPDLSIAFCPGSAPGPVALGLREFDMPNGMVPLLQVVVDTEADFDWDKGTWTDTGRTASIVGLREHAELFLRRGAKPTLVVDHPIATDPRGSEIIRQLAREGCEIGVHLHSWTTPPIVGPKDDWHSFSGNLGPWLERCKLEKLTRQVTILSGQLPRIFKGGRYGISANTLTALRELGFEVDLSVNPAFDYAPMGGPDFTRFSSRPGWFGPAERNLLSLPTTAGWLGWARASGSWMGPLLRRPGMRSVARLATRTNALYPVRLSPEGNDFATLRALTQDLLASGLRIFTLSLHSPTLMPGNTPYARDAGDLSRLLADTARFLDWFTAEVGGRFATTSEIRRAILAGGDR